LSDVYEDTLRAVTVAGDIKDIVNTIVGMMLFTVTEEWVTRIGGNEYAADAVEAARVVRSSLPIRG